MAEASTQVAAAAGAAADSSSAPHLEEQAPRAPTGWKRFIRLGSVSGSSGSKSRRASSAGLQGQENGGSVNETVADDDAQDGAEEKGKGRAVATDDVSGKSTQEEQQVARDDSGGVSDNERNAVGAEVTTADDEAEGDDQYGFVETIEFFHKGAPYYFLSNHFNIPVTFDNISYPTAEHLFQTLKFPTRPDIAKLVRKAESSHEAIRIARKHAEEVRPGWKSEGLNIIAMRQVLLLKFTQHSALRQRLLQTADKDLINASPTDVFWGIGRPTGSKRPGVGRNELGKALIRTREALLATEGLGWGSAAKTV